MQTYLAELEGSRSLHRQRAWALEALLDFAAIETGSARSRLAVSTVLAEGRLERFIAAPLLTGPLSLSGQRARVAAVRSFADWCGSPVRLARQEQVELAGVLPRTVGLHLVSEVWARADRGAEWQRLAAQLAVLLSANLRTVQMCDLRIDQVSFPLPHAVIELQDGPVRLDRAASSQMRAWWLVRADLVERLQGSQQAVWVSVQGNHDPRTHIVRPAGWALKPRGLQRSYAACVEQITQETAAPRPWSWPQRWDLLRRSLHG